jgi:hypothetical protein
VQDTRLRAHIHSLARCCIAMRLSHRCQERGSRAEEPSPGWHYQITPAPPPSSGPSRWFLGEWRCVASKRPMHCNKLTSLNRPEG